MNVRGLCGNFSDPLQLSLVSSDIKFKLETAVYYSFNAQFLSSKITWNRYPG